MRAAGSISAWLQLNRLFLRQFLENDLVSPDADRAQLLAIVGAGVVSLTLFVSMFLSATYAMTVLTPGEAAVRTLNDKFFYSALAMLITALVAAAQWDALAVDSRDAAILDPLPVRPAIVRWAKLSAVAMLGAGAALAVNVFPTMVFPWMLSFSLRQMAAADVFRLMAIHAMVTVTAAAFGYLAVMAMRESVSALLGPKLFTRVSAPLQALTIVVLGSLVLLLPPASTRVASMGFSGWPSQLPPMAFVGLYELASNEFIVDLPRRRVPARMAARDRSNTAVYEKLRPLFRPMAQRVEVLLGTAAALLMAATAVNAFRAPVSGVLLTARGRRRSRLAEAVALLLLVRHPATRAGFHFALATLFRSKTHRLTLACAAAVGLAMALVLLSRMDLQSGARLTPGLLSIQPLLYGSLLVAFRHLIRVPAELRANWAVQLAWQGHPRAFARGVRRAAMVTLALPAIVAVIPVVAIVSGGAVAAGHALLGIAGAAIFIEGLMLGYDKAPFACSYVPGSAKGFVPIFVLVFLLGASLFARLELAIINGSNASMAAMVLAVVFVTLKIASARQREVAIDFDEGPEGFNQLGLHT
jgi:hypothetical protein